MMSESDLHQVPYEEILHAIALDAHSCLPELGETPQSGSDDADHMATLPSQTAIRPVGLTSLRPKLRIPRMNHLKECNTARLSELFQTRGIRLERGAIIDHHLAPKSPGFDFTRVEGMLLGAAIGDALGNTSESKLPLARRRLHAEIRDYLASDQRGRAKGYPSDDTQLTFWTLEQLIEDNGSLVPEHLARKFAESGTIFGIGRTMKEFLRAYKAGIPWHECGPHSAGNGALMRIAPMLIPHLRHGGTDIWTDTAISAMMTHNDHASTSSCLAFTAMLWELLDMRRPPEPAWWPRRYAELASDLQGNVGYAPRGGCLRNLFHGTLRDFVQDKLVWAYAENLSTFEACETWLSGAYLLETVPSALYILMRHAHDPAEAIVRAVNDTKDNDTIASIVGAAVGALHGKRGLPARWVAGLTGRTMTHDDGKVFSLIEEARKEFWQ
jgi:ADP-ribosylglycohydrolase